VPVQKLLAIQLYEWREYELKWGTNSKPLNDYLNNVLKPALMRAGVNHFKLFESTAPGGPRKLYSLISYPDAATYVEAQNLHNDKVYKEASASYHAIPSSKPIYNRFTSSLLHAFKGMKQMDPGTGSNVFELRIYEGYSEDAVRRKIKMFDDEEIPLFYKVGLNPVFFGNMISGPYRPCLVYMLHFEDMAAHAKAWKTFIDAPEWNEMKAKPIYANTVSNIRNVFLKEL